MLVDKINSVYWGSNNVYEFAPLTDPGATCIMSFTNKKMGMFCFWKTEHTHYKIKIA